VSVVVDFKVVERVGGGHRRRLEGDDQDPTVRCSKRHGERRWSGGGVGRPEEDDQRRLCTLHFASWSAFVCLPRYLAACLSSQSNSTTAYSKHLGSSSNLTYIW
jgi:hypothetical protein